MIVMWTAVYQCSIIILSHDLFFREIYDNNDLVDKGLYRFEFISEIYR